MSERSEDVKRKVTELKKEFMEEIDRILSDIDSDEEDSGEGLLKQNRSDRENNPEEYEKRLEGLKQDLKNLKKIKKRQKKISKLEEERLDVLNKIEKKREMERNLRKHKKH